VVALFSIILYRKTKDNYMNYFFGYDVYLNQSIDYMYNLNHILLFVFVAGIILALYFGLHAKTEKGKKITKLCLAGLMIVLEIGRIVWYYGYHFHINGTYLNFNWWWRISFQMCAIMCWLTIITLILSAFLKKDNRVVVVMKNILFGCALIGGFLTIVYPDYITEARSLLHFVNFQTILMHALLVFVPLYFIKIKELHIRIKNLWMPAVGYIMGTSLSVMASQISGQNFAYALTMPLLNDVGLNITYPYHLLVVFGVVFTLTTLLYLVFEIIYRLKHKTKEIKTKIINKKIYVLSVTTFVITILYNLAFVLFLPLLFPQNPVLNLLGLLCLLPLLFVPIMLYGALYFKLLAQDKIKNKKSLNVLTVIGLFISFFPLAIWELILLKKQKN